MSSFCYVVTEKTDDGQIDEVMALFGSHDHVEDYVRDYLVDLWVEGEDVEKRSELSEDGEAGLGTALDACAEAFAAVASWTPSVEVRVRHSGVLDREIRVTAAPLLP